MPCHRPRLAGAAGCLGAPRCLAYLNERTAYPFAPLNHRPVMAFLHSQVHGHEQSLRECLQGSVCRIQPHKRERATVLVVQYGHPRAVSEDEFVTRQTGEEGHLVHTQRQQVSNGGQRCPLAV